MSKANYDDNQRKLKQEYYQKNKERIKLRNKDYSRTNYEKNRKAKLQRGKIYRLKNKDKIAIYQKEYDIKNREKVRNRKTKYTRLRRQNDLNFRLKSNLRSRLNKALKGNYKKGSAIKELGCSIDDLRFWLEFWFEEGMTWDNKGTNKGQWSIDHIIGLVNFDLTDLEQLKKACHYTNLQPMWHIENIKKSKYVKK